MSEEIPGRMAIARPSALALHGLDSGLGLEERGQWTSSNETLPLASRIILSSRYRSHFRETPKGSIDVTISSILQRGSWLSAWAIPTPVSNWLLQSY
jgi:hypothetical protein